LVAVNQNFLHKSEPEASPAFQHEADRRRGEFEWHTTYAALRSSRSLLSVFLAIGEILVNEPARIFLLIAVK